MYANDTTRPELIETIRWSPEEGFHLIELHLSRLARSAKALRYHCEIDDVRSKLRVGVGCSQHPLRVRLVMQPRGGISVTITPHSGTPPGTVWGLALSPSRLDPDDPLLRHKTTSRALYDQERARLCRAGVDEVVFLNLRGEVCEGAIANIFVARGGTLLTPPVSCGLLPGVLRAHL
ncbi:MAG: aminotransferase class IV family protein, partial [Acetobacteraceae bacterium]|nr:aminotransferase class IV family protein [Acetobacteraceae bacterium]